MTITNQHQYNISFRAVSVCYIFRIDLHRGIHYVKVENKMMMMTIRWDNVKDYTLIYITLY